MTLFRKLEWILITGLMLSGFGPVIAQQQCNGLLFATDFDKKPSHGTKDALIHAVNRGEPIRIGWELDFDDDGKPDLAHWAAAAFLSVWEGEVFTQVHAIHSQRPKRGAGEVGLTKDYVEWRGSLGTTGKLEGNYSDNAEFPAGLKSRITWCSMLPRESGWTLLYRNSADGEAVAGSKEALLAAIRSGQPVQIGWGFQSRKNGKVYSAEHLVSPGFITIVNGEDVSAQLPEHIAQRHYADIEQAYFDDPAVMWRGLMSTRGTFDAVWVDRASGETIRRYPQRATLSWFAAHAPKLDTPTMAIPDGVRVDKGLDLKDE